MLSNISYGLISNSSSIFWISHPLGPNIVSVADTELSASKNIEIVPNYLNESPIIYSA